eukprot:scaffold97248_cov63-Phaeocystis_antarctica.AAC.4
MRTCAPRPWERLAAAAVCVCMCVWVWVWVFRGARAAHVARAGRVWHASGARQRGMCVLDHDPAPLHRASEQGGAQPLAQLLGRVARRGDELPAQARVGRVQRPRELRTQVLARARALVRALVRRLGRCLVWRPQQRGEGLRRGRHRAHQHATPTEAKPLAVREARDRLPHGGGVVRRLPHPHEDRVGERRQAGGGSLALGRVHLAKDLAHVEVAAQPHLARRAERARLPTAHLRRDAHGRVGTG